jgi:CRP/FNR family transcriptional regulator, anaerobic regulatory protein
MSISETRHNVLPHPALLRAGGVAPKPERPVLRLLTPGETIGREDEPASRLYRIREGCIALCGLLPDGRRQITDVLGPDRSFGRAQAGPEHYIAQAMTFTEVEVLDTSTAPNLAADAAQAALARLRHHATLLGRMTAAEKTANALIDLARQFPRKGRSAGGSQSFTLYLTRADLADWLGLTLETVSRTLNRFKRSGLIDFTQAEIVVLTNPRQLKIMAAGLSNPDQMSIKESQKSHA